MQGWGAFSKERTVELSFSREDLGARKKSRSVNGLRVVRNRKSAKWAGGRPQGLSISKYPSNSEALFGRELSSSGA